MSGGELDVKFMGMAVGCIGLMWIVLAWLICALVIPNRDRVSARTRTTCIGVAAYLCGVGVYTLSIVFTDIRVAQWWQFALLLLLPLATLVFRQQLDEGMNAGFPKGDGSP